ncbi:HNH endonuclease signature motif containing protein [Amycolatopsis sp. NBC_01480]|uniref:HNH endonuclease signature motif containing protein n=1 Tax=Amycolatopsis sp. NBC_01480 TaxID=2903562 RepID=UPI002E2BE0A3|nr:DUF222 domain-containing protein [Amycolatopsis sp. NBC_01480]
MERTEQVPVWQLSEEELTTELLAVERMLCRGYARMLEVVGEVDRRGVAVGKGFRSTAVMLVRALRVSQKEARARVTQATTALPVMRAALAAGDLNREHAAEIASVLTHAPDTVTFDDLADTESTLVTLARQAPPFTVRKTAQRIRTYWDFDGVDPGKREQDLARPRREFRFTRTRDGRMRYSGELDAEMADLTEQLFTVLAKPAPVDPFGNPDPRTRSQRQGDAIAAILDLAARAPEVPVKAGERVVATVTIPLADLQRRAGTVTPDGHTPMTVSQLRRLCCDAKVLPAVLNGAGEVLDLGRAVRTATPAQRRALAVRDKGCTAPWCTKGPKWTTPHHIEFWANLQGGPGGRTDITNLASICEADHRIAHHEGWTIRLRNGTVEWLPPAWLDPQRRPLHNTTHHPPHAQAA